MDYTIVYAATAGPGRTRNCDGWYGCDPVFKYEFRSSKSIMERPRSPEPPDAAGLYVLVEMRGEIEALEDGVAKDVADGDGDVDT